MHGLSTSEAACRLVYRVYTTHITRAVHSSSISDERTFTFLCSVNTVPHTLRLLTVELICSKVLLTCICAELRVDSLGEETSFIRSLRIINSITNKGITNTVMQLGRGCIIYCCTVTDSIFQCLFTINSVVWFLYFSLQVLFIYCKITSQ